MYISLQDVIIFVIASDRWFDIVINNKSPAPAQVWHKLWDGNLLKLWEEM